MPSENTPLKKLINFESPDFQDKITELAVNFSSDLIPESAYSTECDFPELSNPMLEELQALRTEVVNQTKELQHIRYENMKLNAQINTMNKIIDSKNDELDNLRNINTELKIANKTLKESNDHYWRNTFIISFVVALIFFVLGLIIP